MPPAAPLVFIGFSSHRAPSILPFLQHFATSRLSAGRTNERRSITFHSYPCANDQTLVWKPRWCPLEGPDWPTHIRTWTQEKIISSLNTPAVLQRESLKGWTVQYHYWQAPCNKLPVPPLRRLLKASTAASLLQLTLLGDDGVAADWCVKLSVSGVLAGQYLAFHGHR